MREEPQQASAKETLSACIRLSSAHTCDGFRLDNELSYSYSLANETVLASRECLHVKGDRCLSGMQLADSMYWPTR